MENYYVYILYSAKLDRYYIGQTQDIKARITKHLVSKKQFTGKADDWVLKYSEEFPNRSEAYQREQAIKRKKSRKYIEHLINSQS